MYPTTQAETRVPHTAQDSQSLGSLMAHDVPDFDNCDQVLPKSGTIKEFPVSTSKGRLGIIIDDSSGEEIRFHIREVLNGSVETVDPGKKVTYTLNWSDVYGWRPEKISLCDVQAQCGTICEYDEPSRTGIIEADEDHQRFQMHFDSIVQRVPETMTPGLRVTFNTVDNGPVPAATNVRFVDLPPCRGTIKFYKSDQKFGRISSATGESVNFTQGAIAPPEAQSHAWTLRKGDPVTYYLEKNIAKPRHVSADEKNKYGQKGVRATDVRLQDGWSNVNQEVSHCEPPRGSAEVAHNVTSNMHKADEDRRDGEMAGLIIAISAVEHALDTIAGRSQQISHRMVDPGETLAFDMDWKARLNDSFAEAESQSNHVQDIVTTFPQHTKDGTNRFAIFKVGQLPELLLQLKAAQSKVEPSMSARTPSLRSATGLAAKPLRIIEYSRDPACFHELLWTCPELKPCRDALIHSGLRVELASGAKAFVHPEQYEPLLRSLHFHPKLNGRHVIVDVKFEETVKMVVQKLPREAKARRANQFVLPLTIVKHTFIDIDLPSSLRSEPNQGACTASTSEAHGVQNPRRA